MEENNKKRTLLLWGVLIVFFVGIIGFMLIQMSPQQETELTANMEQTFPQAPEEEPPMSDAFAEAIQQGQEEQQELMDEESDSDLSSSETMETQEEPTTAVSETPATNSMALPAPKKETQKTSETPVSSEPLPSESIQAPSDTPEQALLAEKGERHWEILSKKQGVSNQTWQTIMIQNRSKYDYLIYPSAERNWKLEKQGNKIKVQMTSESSDGKDILSRKKQGKYAVQMISFEENRFTHAIKVLRMLVKDGYYAYIFKTNVKHKGHYWYRVRIGFFKTADEAQAKGHEVFYRYQDRKIFPKNYWAVLPSSRELSKEIIDLRAPINKPWLLELPSYDLKAKAIADLPIFAAIADFVYVSQKKNTQTGKMVFRTRLGFYETQNEAQATLIQLARRHDILKNAQVVKL